MFAALLAFVYRYIHVLFDELARMRTAQRGANVQTCAGLARLEGSRAARRHAFDPGLVRAERIHGAMCSRG